MKKVLDNGLTLVYKTEYKKNFTRGHWMIDVTDKAERVFGKEIKEAWITLRNVYESETHEQAYNSIFVSFIANNISRMSEMENEKGLTLPFESEVYITFNNGKILVLHTSEWGGIEVFNPVT